MGVRDLFGLCKNGSEIPVEIGLNPIESMEGALVLASTDASQAPIVAATDFMRGAPAAP